MTDPVSIPPARPQRRRRLLLPAATLIVSAFVVGIVVLDADGAGAAEVSLEQCNGAANTGGLTVQCHIDIINTITDDPATTGSVVTLNGGAPTSSPDIVTTVDQCNGSANGGGGTILCSVNIVNNIAVSGPAAPTGATVNQCNDNQATDGLGNPPNPCTPFPAGTTGATITQCNGSGNGGGLVFPSTCDAAGTISATLPLTVNQCNGSGNGGGGRVVCSTSISTIVIDVSQPTTGSTSPSTATSATPTPSTDPGGVTTAAPVPTTPTPGEMTTALAGSTPSATVPTPSTGGAPSSSSGTPTGLPVTGSNALLPLVAATALLVVGGVLLVAGRRRRA